MPMTTYNEEWAIDVNPAGARVYHLHTPEGAPPAEMWHRLDGKKWKSLRAVFDNKCRDCHAEVPMSIRMAAFMEKV